MPNFQDLPNLEGESILTYIFKFSLGIKLRVLKCVCVCFFFGAFSPAQMRRTRKISCQKHLSWASLITQMLLHWKELLHKVSRHWFSRQQWMILRGTEHLGKCQETFISFFLCDVLRGIPLRAPLLLYFSQKIFFCRSLRRNPPGHWVILIFSGQKFCTRVIYSILHSFLHVSRAKDLINYL